MAVKDLINKLMEYVREGELCSCPILLYNGDKVELAVFTYYASAELPMTVFGYGQIIKANGDSVETEEQELFQSESELIVIDNIPIVSVEEHKKLYDNYYNELQKALDSIEDNGKIQNRDNLAIAFNKIIPNEAMELYRRICPRFLQQINV